MYQILRRFVESGYTTVLVFPEAYSYELLDVVDYYVPCTTLFADELHKHQQIQLQPLHLQNSVQKSAQTVVYWDSKSCHIPTNEHQQALEQIRLKVLKQVGPGHIEIRAYFERGALPSYKVAGVRYIEATNAKKDSLPNTLFTDMVKSAITHSEPANVVLISGVSVFSPALKFLKTLKVRVFTVMPDRSNCLDRESFTILRNSGSLLCYWPPAFEASEYQNRWNRNVPPAKRGREESNAKGSIDTNVKRKLNDWS